MSNNASYNSSAQRPDPIIAFLGTESSRLVLGQLLADSGQISAAQQAQADRNTLNTRLQRLRPQPRPDSISNARPSHQPNTPSMSRGVDLSRSPAEVPRTRPCPFIPSYLVGSAYAKKLAAKFPELKQPPPTFLGRHFRPSQEDADTGDIKVNPIPTYWDENDKHVGLEVSSDGLELRHVGSKEQRENDTSSIRANCPIPKEVGLYYYEVSISHSKAKENKIGVGFVTSKTSLNKPPGWEAGSYGYHGDDGSKFSGSLHGGPYHSKFSAGDTIGCGINFYTKEVFFTKNGIYIGPAFQNVSGDLYPGIGIQHPSDGLRANFGAMPFTFDIDSMVERQRSKIQTHVRNTPFDTLHPSQSESQFLQELVMQALENDGYIETARAFAAAIRKEEQALAAGIDGTDSKMTTEDDEETVNRQTVRYAVLTGDIDQAEKMMRLYYPALLDANKDILFRLQCQRFIEMVRLNTGMRNRIEKRLAKDKLREARRIETDQTKLNPTPHEESDDEEISLDRAEFGAPQDNLDLQESEFATLEYGRKLDELYRDDTRPEVSAALKEIWSTMAYQNPLTETKFDHLFSRRARMEIAEEVNSAVLSHLGKSSRTALDTAYASTAVLLDEISGEVSGAAFVTVEDAFRMIAKESQYPE
ncbi:Ran-binding protein 10 [Ceratocystis lukuohia]|uniref:Ran-binding protein 10 n=1 Tax=Ceratocystis lukuohia TaxID=2019550 RepID=A0ABR4MGX8_9PEZI